ncbi:MAG TPA: aminotransferase class V-fold PLP-dependent enzyme [Gemmatimonadaceae bacterium]
MSTIERDIESLRQRRTPLAMDAARFREIGHRLVDDIGERLARIADGPVTRGESVADVRLALGTDARLPAEGTDAAALLDDVTEQLFAHALFNGHPRFFGYITSSPAPIGMFGDFLASAVNQNVGAWNLAPLASEMEAQVVRWLAEFIGYPTTCGGLLVSGGNMANFVGFLAARTSRAPWMRKEGAAGRQRLLVYASHETHTWLQKAVDMAGLGTDSIRWVPVDRDQRMDSDVLQVMVEEDKRRGHHPFLVVATAGTVSTGAIDPIAELALVCREEDLWLHVDGAYGALAARVPGAPLDLDALCAADSVAVDPHKWLYAPLEAGCVLVKDAARLREAFSYHPPYYHFDEEALNYYERGPQNSRGFRALKVWLALKQAGRDGYRRMIGDDIALARHLSARLNRHAELHPASCRLSITTFRYVPVDLAPLIGGEDTEAYLNDLNQQVLDVIEKSGEAYMSSAVVDGRFLLRTCIVNFHTSLDDVEAVPPLVARIGREIDTALRGGRVLSQQQAPAAVPGRQEGE